MSGKLQRIYLTSKRKLADGLHDGEIVDVAAARPFKRLSISILLDGGGSIRADVELEPDDYQQRKANVEQFHRLVEIVGQMESRELRALIGRRVGLRIHRGQFVQFEAALVREVAK
jgi:hypothetical protein